MTTGPCDPSPAAPPGRVFAPGGWENWVRLAGLALLGIMFAVLAADTWRKWPDPLVDFGSQLYIPWQINQGAVLYRDLYYFAGGPFSQYFNALLFKCFGASFSTLMGANLIFAVLLLGLVYQRFRAAADSLTATMTGLTLIMGFTFAQYLLIGNYNYIAPYSHETVHGILLSALAIGLMSDWLLLPRRWQPPLIGLCAGLVFLTKPDIFLALLACAVTAAALHGWRGGNLRALGRPVAGFLAALVVPLLFFFLLFLRVENWRLSLHSVIYGWTPLFEPDVRNSVFYVGFRGMDHPLPHLQRMAAEFLSAGAVITLYAILFRGLARWQGCGEGLRWLVWLALVSPLLIWARHFQWVESGISLPLWCLALLMILLWRLKRAPQAPRLIFPLLWTVFALAIMSKLGVWPRIFQCGFALAMPAFIATVYLLLWLLPEWLADEYQVPQRFMRATAAVVLFAGLMVLTHFTGEWARLKQQAIGHGGDQFYIVGPTLSDGSRIRKALDWIDDNVPAKATLAVLPSGVTINYLTRHVNPTPCLFWDPNAMGMWGQAAMTARFESTPPDYVVLVHQDQSEFGVGILGSYPGYGVDLMQWIKQNYDAAALIGDEPFQAEGFGIKILHRRTSSAGPGTATPPPS